MSGFSDDESDIRTLSPIVRRFARSSERNTDYEKVPSNYIAISEKGMEANGK